MILEKDKSIIRELAKRYMEFAGSEKQKKMFKRFRDSNDLKIVRPPVILDEIPWYQLNMDDELTCICEGEKERGVELQLRKALFYVKHFKADNFYEPFIRIARTVENSGIGVSVRDSNQRRTDDFNIIVSHEYEDVLADEESLNLIHDPVYTLRPDKDAENVEYFTDLLGDTMPVKLFGYADFYFPPWDYISSLRGVEPIMLDMYSRPEHIHAIMKKFTSIANARIDFYEKNLTADPTMPSVHCTPASISGMAEDGMKATWFRGMAQTLGMVSPKMFKEFEIDYIKPIAERFAYTYYGCCEALHDRIDILKSISNLRKIGCSPWANVEQCAEQIGKDYVLARKPNPSHVAIKTDPAVIRREIEETVKICIKYGCPCEFTLKDISTVSNRPENLIVWAKTVSSVLDEYYGPA